MRDEFGAILKALEKGQSVVRVSVMKSSGSTPRTAGACMVVFEDGTMTGTIGGGTVEYASHEAAKKLNAGESQVRDFDLTNNDAASLGMVCGGAMTVLLDSMLPEEEPIALIREALASYQTTEKQLFATTLGANGTVLGRQIVQPNDTMPRSLRAPFVQDSGDGGIFFEPLISPTRIHFIGAGHVAQATAKLAAFTDFQVIVVDDRDDFANSERYPEAQEIRVADSLKSCLAGPLGTDDYVVIMTRGHLHDRDVLAQALKTEAGYVGMIGSKKKKAAVYKSLLDDGFVQDDLKRVHCPIGLSIGAETPEEIAVSIMGEIIAHKASATT